jgi:hypothetical protein
MLKTLRISFALKNTYRVNGILYGIRQIPLIGKLFPADIYGIDAFKVLANIIGWIWELITAVFGKVLYFFLMLALPLMVMEVNAEEAPRVFLHLFVGLSVMGAYANDLMFKANKERYYGIILLGMNAKQFMLIQYGYALVKLFVGFVLCGLVLRNWVPLAVWEVVLLPIGVAGFKTAYIAVELARYEKTGSMELKSKWRRFDWIGMLLMAGIVYGLPIAGYSLPRMGSVALLVLGIVCGFAVLPKLRSFSYYRAVFQECYGVSLDQMDQVKNAQSEMDKKYISTDTEITSDKQGFELLNDLFIKRHRSLLWKPSLIVSCGALVLIVLILLWLSFVPEMKEKLNAGILGSFSAFVFLMYAVNRGTDYTRVQFVNCDHSLLTYSFYKVPGQILKLFRIRLWGIMKVNLLPAVIIGAGVDLLLFASGGTDKPLNYLIIFVSIVGLAVFFSVHYLTMYYLLQPFNAGSEVKNGFYKLIMSLTYIVCYVMWQAEISLSGFGIGVIIFCVLYSVIACLLVYKLAWKTFKIR